MRVAVLWILSAAMVLAGDGRGIRPRPNQADYPARESAGGVTVAAAVMPPDQVRNTFATDLNRGGYIVLEVAVFPDSGKEINLAAADFALKTGAGGNMIRPASAKAIASILQQKNSPHPQQPSRASDITVYPSATIGYESGGGYDPVTGQRRPRGVYTGGGVAVATGPNGPQAPPPPASTDRDRSTMQEELQDLALPEGRTVQAVAGYLYFPRPAGKPKNVLYEVTYYGEGGKVRVALPGK